MTAPIKPLRECIRSFRDRIAKNYDAASTSELIDRIIGCDLKLLGDKTDCDRVDALRAVNWYINAAFTRRGIPPSSRRCLGPIPIRATKLLHHIKKQDAPYLDLQWLAFKYPECLPKRWSGINTILSTAPGMKASSLTPAALDGSIVFGEIDRDEVLDDVFNHADRLVNRKVSIAKLCTTLKLPTAAQSEMRWLCSRKTRQLIRDLNVMEDELRDKMHRQGIKQLKPAMIDTRVHTFRAWKLAGGGTNWQATADILEGITGVRKTRQAIKDMITRLGSQKLIKRRNRKKRTLEPLLTK